MVLTRHSWLEILGGAGLAVLAGAGVVSFRLAGRPVAPENPSQTGSLPGVRDVRGTIAEEIPLHLLSPENALQLARWMEVHPGQVMDQIDPMEDRERAGQLTKALVKSIQGPHSDLLLNWLTRQKDKQIAALIFRGLIPRLAGGNPEQCVALAFGLGDGEDARNARDELFFRLPLDQRMRLLNQQNPEERAWLMSRNAYRFGDRAPDLCLQVIRDLPKSEHAGQALEGLMKVWTGGANVWHLADPVAAVEGVMTLPDAEMKEKGLRVAMSEWARTDPDLAAKWVNRLSSGQDRDAAIGGMVNSLAVKDSARAMEWAGTITDEESRLKAIEDIRQMVSDKGKEDR